MSEEEQQAAVQAEQPPREEAPEQRPAAEAEAGPAGEEVGARAGDQGPVIEDSRLSAPLWLQAVKEEPAEPAASQAPQPAEAPASQSSSKPRTRRQVRRTCCNDPLPPAILAPD